MVGGSFQDFDRCRSVYCYTTRKETSARSEAELCRMERVFYGSVRRRFADDTTVGSRRLLTFSQTVDTVVQQNHIQVDIATYRMDEVIAANGQPVTVTGNLPDG